MHEQHGFSWLAQVLPAEMALHYNHVLTAGIVAALLLMMTGLASLRLKSVMSNVETGMVPQSKFSLFALFDLVSEALYNLVKGVLGEHEAPHYYSFIGSLFLYIFVSNMLGLVPGFTPPTDNLNTTLALGVFVFLYYNYVGLKTNGLTYLKHFFGPVLWLAPLMLVIELVSHVFRPMTLGLRLRGNIYADHMVLSAFTDLAPWFVPILVYCLGIFISFIQSFVFCLLTMVYISLATEHDH